MILGYEQPVDIPVMSIYDKDMMKMYLGALQQDYKEGLEEQKEFNKMAADFYSPSDVDNQNWYNITAKPLQDYLNQNPDAIRSVEGRAWIRNFINSRPYAQMATMRQSAETLKKYKDLASKLKAAGKFSQDLERIQGVGDPSTWDTLKNGAWTWDSPTEMQSVWDLTHERFDPLAKLDFDLGPGRDKYHRMKGVTEEHMRPRAKTSLDGIRHTPYNKLFLERYGSDEAIEDAFINANKGVLHNAELTDDVELEKMKQREENKRAARASSQTPPVNPYSVTTQIRNDSVSGLGYNSMADYMSAVSSKAVDAITAEEKKTGKKLSQARKNAIIADTERREQQKAISNYMRAGYNRHDAILNAGLSTAPVDDIANSLWGNSVPDNNGYYRITNNQRRNLYTEGELLQLYARKPFRKKVTKGKDSKQGDKNTISRVKVETVNNHYHVYDPEQNRHRYFAALEGADKSRYYVEVTDALDPRSSSGMGTDALHSVRVKQPNKSLYSVEETNQTYGQ